MKQLLRRSLQSLGVDIVRLPMPHTLSKHLQDLLPRLDVTCVLDIGANRGQYARLLRAIGYRGWIVSFEPMPDCIRLLRAKASRDGRWLVYPFAVGAQSSRAELHLYSNTELNSLLAIDSRARHISTDESAPAGSAAVEVVRLADVIPEIERQVGSAVYFLKSDTQGYDLNVLRGAEDVLHRIEGLQVELALKPFYHAAPSYEQLVAAMRDYGYSVTGFFPVASDPDGTLVEVDCVARRRADV